MEKSFKTAAPYRIGIMGRSQRYRKSLAGLLVTMPGVDILSRIHLQKIYSR